MQPIFITGIGTGIGPGQKAAQWMAVFVNSHDAMESSTEAHSFYFKRINLYNDFF